MNANPLGFSIGLQLYTVEKEMEEDPAGTLKRVAAVGYKEVETSPFSKISTQDLRKLLDDAGLKSPSGHHLLPDLQIKLQEKIDRAKELGQEYMVVTVPSWLIRRVLRVIRRMGNWVCFSPSSRDYARRLAMEC